MTTEQALRERSGNQCELCGATDALDVYGVPPHSDGGADQSILACAICRGQMADPDTMDPNHWRCLNDSMWTPVPAVQVVAWRMLNRLSSEGWPQELLDMLYLDEETQAWAQSDVAGGAEEAMVHRDCNGVVLEAGDAVTLTKDLNVKGSSLTAKRGTAVRNIRLVQDNPEQIEGRVDGQQIVILTRFVKKSG